MLRWLLTLALVFPSIGVLYPIPAPQSPPRQACEECCAPRTSAEETVAGHVIARSYSIRDGRRRLGTGVLITRGGKRFVLTAEHVSAILEDRPATLVDRDGNSFSASVAWKDEDRDVSLLVPSSDLVGVPFPIEDSVTGEPDDTIWFCGSGAGVDHNLVRTHVSKRDAGFLLLGGGGGWYGHSGSGAFVLRKGRYLLAGLVVGATEETGKLIIAVDLSAILASLKDYDASQ